MKRSINDISGPPDEFIASNPSPAKKVKLCTALDFLVPDTLKLIFTQLDRKSQRLARLVCKHWLDIINLSEFKLRHIHRDELPLVFSVLGRYSKPISVRFTNLEEMHPKHFPELTKLTSLTSFSGRLLNLENSEFLSALTELQSLSTDHVSTATLHVLTNLTKVSCVNIVDALQEPVTQMKQLEIKGQKCQVSPDSFPNLESLTYLKKIDKVSPEIRWHLTGLEALVVTEYSSNRSYPITLTRLDIQDINFDMSFANRDKLYSTMTTLTNLKHLGVPALLQQEILPCYPKLEKCDVGSVFDLNVWKKLVQCSHLTSLKVHLGIVPPEEYVLALTKLRDLTIRGTLSVTELDMSLFSSLVHLKRLWFTSNGKKDANIYNFKSLTTLTALQCLQLYHRVNESFVDNLTNLTMLRIGLSLDFVLEQKLFLTKLKSLKELIVENPVYTRIPELLDGHERMTYLTSLTIMGSVPSVADSNPRPTKKVKIWTASDFLVEDTLKLILSKLDLNDQLKSRQVCKQWFDIISLSEFNIKSIRPDELPLVISVLSRYSKPISVSFKNFTANPTHFLELTRLTNLKSFKGFLLDEECSIVFSALTGLQLLETDYVSTEILPVLTNLTHLSCDSLVGTIKGQVTQLKELHIYGENCQVSPDWFPNLKALTFMKKIGYPIRWHLTGLESLVIAEYSSNRFYPITLTRLDIHEHNFDRPLANREKLYSTMSTLTNLKHLGVPGTLQQELISHYPNLEKCDVGSVFDLNVWKKLVQCSHLTSLKVHLGIVPPEEYVLSLTKLRDLTIRGTLSVTELDMSLFSSLVHLTRLWFTNSGFKMDVKIHNFKSLTTLTALRQLEIDHKVQDPFIEHLTNLTSIRIGFAKDLVQTEKQCLSNLTNLLELVVNNSVHSCMTDMFDGIERMTQLTRLTVMLTRE